MKVYNWNYDARDVYPPTGPQNPHKIYVYDDGVDYWIERYKPGWGPRWSTKNLVAIFTVKYTVK